MDCQLHLSIGQKNFFSSPQLLVFQWVIINLTGFSGTPQGTRVNPALVVG